MTKALFQNEVEIEELEQAIFLKKFSWGEKIICMMRFVEKLEDESIKYAIQTNTKFRCQNLFVGRADKREIIVKGIMEE